MRALVGGHFYAEDKDGYVTLSSHGVDVIRISHDSARLLKSFLEVVLKPTHDERDDWVEKMGKAALNQAVDDLDA